MPNTSEIINDLSTAREITNRSSTILWRLKELLACEEFDNLKRHEALTLVEGLIPMPDEVLGALQCAAKLAGTDDLSPAAETGNDNSWDGDEYRRIVEKKASATVYLDVSYRLYDAAKTLCVLSNIAATPECEDDGASQKLLATSAYRVHDLIDFAQALDGAARKCGDGH